MFSNDIKDDLAMNDQLSKHDSRFRIHEILKNYWGFEKFRPLQQDIIESILMGNDTLALMPTGGGKSLCYQVPAFAKEGMCLVISPLIALMKDQVESLRKKNTTAYSIYSGMTRKELIRILTVVTESNCKFLFVSPERLETALFKEYLPGMHINLVAVDEAHCISQWGYDFRPSYLKIAALREELPGVPFLALTASATEQVQRDICEKLTSPSTTLLKVENSASPPSAAVRVHRSAAEENASPPAPLPKGRGEQFLKVENSFNNWRIFRQSFERPNLSYSAFKVDSKISRIIEILRKVPGCGIVYCKSRKRTKEISDLLRLEDISCDYYHAGLSNEERNLKQEDWIKNRIRVIVCTNAFGMGIDKPDVRIVIHADTPDCLENYYQEAGRAGRDGRTSYAVLLYDNQDLKDLNELPIQRFPKTETIRAVYQAVVNYLQLPIGGGTGQYYDFEIGDFLKKFKLDSYAGLYSLKALENEGWLAFNEQVFLPATARFIINKDSLYRFEKDRPSLEDVIKILLRSYEGIFDHPSSISEKMIASLLRKDVEEIKKQLSALHQAGIIEYIPQKDSPQLLLLRSRVKAEEIVIDMMKYNSRKEQFRQRIDKMVRFAKEESECRSRIIGIYFGDQHIRACGVCDNCLRRKGTTLNKEEFETIHHRIVNIVKYESLPVRDLLLKLNGIKKEKAWKVIEFLQAEHKIEMDNAGWIKLR